MEPDKRQGAGSTEQGDGKVKNRKDELLRSKLTRYQNIATRIILKASPPNVLIGGPVPVSLGFPPKDGSVQSHVADPIEAFGNDGL
jgi:hypothetical protein